MIEYELNEAYKKLSNSIDSQFHDEIYRKIINYIDGLEEIVFAKNDECINQYGISEDFSIAKRDITNMIEDAKENFRANLVARKEEIDQIFYSFYVGMNDTISKDLSKEEKNKLMSRYVDDLKYSVSALNNNIKNSVEIYDELEGYYRRRSGDDAFYDEMRYFLRDEKRKFMKNYIDEINNLLNHSLIKVKNDIENYVLPSINKETKTREEENLHQETKTGEAVSKKIDGGSISSPYYNIDTSNMKNNRDLYYAVAQLIPALVFMDIFRDKNTYKRLIDKFAETLSACKSTNDFQMFDNFLKSLSNMGGYASKFYSDISHKINANGKEEAINYIENIKSVSVTKKLNDGSISSPYYKLDISYFKDNKELYDAIGPLISALAFMDLYGNENANNSVKEKYSKVYLACKKRVDFQKLDDSLKLLANMGGYAFKFYSAVSPSLKEATNNYVEREIPLTSVEKSEEISQQTEIVHENIIEKEEVKTEVVEEQKEEQPMNNTKKSVYYEISDQFTKGIETIINQKIHFLERHNLSLKLHDISFMQAREIDEASSKMLYAIAEMYQMKKETREEDSNLLLDNFVAYVENCMKKDYASNVFEDVAKKIMNNNDLWLTFEQMEQINNLAEESKNNFNLYMRNELMSMQKETLEKANKYFGIVYPTSNDEVLEENKGHKI